MFVQSRLSARLVRQTVAGAVACNLLCAQIPLEVNAQEAAPPVAIPINCYGCFGISDLVAPMSSGEKRVVTGSDFTEVLDDFLKTIPRFSWQFVAYASGDGIAAGRSYLKTSTDSPDFVSCDNHTAKLAVMVPKDGRKWSDILVKSGFCDGKIIKAADFQLRLGDGKFFGRLSSFGFRTQGGGLIPEQYESCRDYDRVTGSTEAGASEVAASWVENIPRICLGKLTKTEDIYDEIVRKQLATTLLNLEQRTSSEAIKQAVETAVKAHIKGAAEEALVSEIVDQVIEKLKQKGVPGLD